MFVRPVAPRPQASSFGRGLFRPFLVAGQAAPGFVAFQTPLRAGWQSCFGILSPAGELGAAKTAQLLRSPQGLVASTISACAAPRLRTPGHRRFPRARPIFQLQHRPARHCPAAGFVHLLPVAPPCWIVKQVFKPVRARPPGQRHGPYASPPSPPGPRARPSRAFFAQRPARQHTPAAFAQVVEPRPCPVLWPTPSICAATLLTLLVIAGIGPRPLAAAREAPVRDLELPTTSRLFLYPRK